MTNGIAVAALVAPLLSLDRRLRVVAPVVAAIAWAALLVTDASVDLGPLAPDRLGLAVAAGTALLSARRPSGLTDDFDVPLMGSLLALAAVWSTSSGQSPAPLVVVLVVVAFFSLEGRAWRGPLLLGAAAVLAMVAVVLEQRTGAAAFRPAGGLAATLPAALAAAAVLVTTSGMRVGRAAIVLPTALALALRTVPGVIGTSLDDAAPIVCAGLAVFLALPAVIPDWMARRWPTRLAFDVGDAVVIGLVVFAVASVPGGTPSAALLASGAVMATVAGGRLAVAATAPGVVAALTTLADGGAPSAVAAVVVAAAVAASMATRRDVVVVDPGEPDVLVAPVLGAVVGVWLLLAPRTWGWVGPVELGAFDDGVAVAMAAGLAVFTGVVAAQSRRGEIRLTLLPLVAQPPEGQEPAIRSALRSSAVRGREPRERSRRR